MPKHVKQSQKYSNSFDIKICNYKVSWWTHPTCNLHYHWAAIRSTCDAPVDGKGSKMVAWPVEGPIFAAASYCTNGCLETTTWNQSFTSLMPTNNVWKGNHQIKVLKGTILASLSWQCFHRSIDLDWVLYPSIEPHHAYPVDYSNSWKCT